MGIFQRDVESFVSEASKCTIFLSFKSATCDHLEKDFASWDYVDRVKT